MTDEHETFTIVPSRVDPRTSVRVVRARNTAAHGGARLLFSDEYWAYLTAPRGATITQVQNCASAWGEN